MWSNFYVPGQESRAGLGVLGVTGGPVGNAKRRAAPIPVTKDSQQGKIKLTCLMAMVGVTLTVLGVVTAFWVELTPSVSLNSNQTCLSAHYGLWKICESALWIPEERRTCWPAELPEESNCTYFKFFTTGDNAVIFKKMTEKSLNIGAAILAIFSLVLMVVATICIAMFLSKGVNFFLKPASVCFILSGVLVLLAVIVFHQSVLSLLASDHSVPLHHKLSWSVSCVGSGGAIVILGGVIFFLLTFPFSACLTTTTQPNSMVE